MLRIRRLAVGGEIGCTGAPTAGAVGVRRHTDVTIIVALLSLSTLPLELGFGKVGLGAPLVLAFIVLWVRYRATPSASGGPVPLLLVLLLGWSVVRLTVFELIQSNAIPWTMVAREALTLGGCLAAFSLARRPALWPAIKRGVVICLVLILAQEAYQLMVGLPRLQALGYRADAEFFYYTEAGGYRPFGTFSGPTLFGTFLAMVGMWVTLSLADRPRWAGLVGVATVGAVLASETRAAFVGIGISVIAVGLASPVVRRRLGPIAVFAPLALAATILYRPGLFSAPFDRLLSATDTTDSSRSTRIDLWEGVVHATSNNGAALVAGFGPADWEQIMYPEVGDIVFYLGHAHSNFFQEWYRYGMVGALLFGVLAVGLLVEATRGVRSGLPLAAAGMAAALVFISDSIFNNSLSNANYILMVFLLIGTAVPSSARLQRERSDPIVQTSTAAVGQGRRARRSDTVEQR